MIRKYKDLTKTWEKHSEGQEKQVQPFPQGLSNPPESVTITSCTSEEWMAVMGPSSGWESSAEDLGWYKEIVGLSLYMENISAAIDGVLTGAEMNGGTDASELNIKTVRNQFKTLSDGLNEHTGKVVNRVLPYLRNELPADHATSCTRTALKKLEKCHSVWCARSETVRQSFDNCTETSHNCLFKLRQLKYNYDVFQSTTVVYLQVEVEVALYLVRKYLSETEWVRHGEMGMAFRASAEPQPAAPKSDHNPSADHYANLSVELSCSSWLVRAVSSRFVPVE